MAWRKVAALGLEGSRQVLSKQLHSVHPLQGTCDHKGAMEVSERAGNKPPGGAGLKQRAGRVGRGLCGRGHTCAEALGTVLPGVSEDVSQCGWWRTGLVACWAVRAN